ncbi:Proteasomal ubiquitin receptor ADRM1 [Strongyloides ratti]|uniref:Proteasomal ubiquitin receptor ADRM1 n=1 Tax=Strongyloides ratti TaxID=34506 RepID=A0A090LMY5_STRRB|nr:Proteasomal ubiquitin receptor ADRM1 [Strongyloides ratti]CEF71106.1 Proteasomal ubiquitin receptor ADRM1 [Strongyloides ratti]
MAIMFTKSLSTEINKEILFKFKCGKSILLPGSSKNTRKVTAEETKGIAFIKKSFDQLTHFCWMNSEKNIVIDDFIIFPGETEFKEVSECFDGRVFMLKFKSTNERKLYWFQESDRSKGDKIVRRVNKLLNIPQNIRLLRSRKSDGRRSRDSTLDIRNLNDPKKNTNEMLRSLDQNQLMHLLNLINGETTINNNQPINNNMNDNIFLNNLNLPQKNNQEISSSKKQVDLSRPIAPSNFIEPGKQNSDKSKSLNSNELPIKQNFEEVKTSLVCPSFESTAATISYKIKRGQAGTFLEEFNYKNKSLSESSKNEHFDVNKTLSKDSSNMNTNNDNTKYLVYAKSDTINNEEDDNSMEPEPKKNKPGIDNVDID